jgi:hypothetical protein
VGRELAHDDRAGIAQARHRERVGTRHMVLHHFGMAGCRDPRGLVDVLQSDRDAVQGPTVAVGRDLGLCGARIGARLLRQHADEAVEAAVEPCDAIEPALHKLNGR